MKEVKKAVTMLFLVLAGLHMAAPVGANVTYKNVEKLLTKGQPINFRNHLYYETMVRKYFANDPMMVRIARCESNMRQYDENGRPLRGEINPHDIGLLQINETLHKDRARSIGYDIYTTEGNLGYGTVLKRTEGLRPWVFSRYCWALQGAKDLSLAVAAAAKAPTPLSDRSKSSISSPEGRGVMLKFGLR